MSDLEQGRVGSTLDEFLADEGLLDAASEHAVKAVLAWQVREAMRVQGLSKTAMAQRMSTSRAQLDRLLDPGNGSVTLQTLQRAAAVLGKRVRVELV